MMVKGVGKLDYGLRNVDKVCVLGKGPLHTIFSARAIPSNPLVWVTLEKRINGDEVSRC